MVLLCLWGHANSLATTIRWLHLQCVRTDVNFQQTASDFLKCALGVACQQDWSVVCSWTVGSVIGIVVDSFCYLFLIIVEECHVLTYVMWCLALVVRTCFFGCVAFSHGSQHAWNHGYWGNRAVIVKRFVMICVMDCSVSICSMIAVTSVATLLRLSGLEVTSCFCL